jgi:hypothetical protein
VEVLSKLLFLLKRSCDYAAQSQQENGPQVAEIDGPVLPENLHETTPNHRSPRPPQGPRHDTIIWDSEVPGFGIRLRTSGAKAGSSNSVIAPQSRFVTLEAIGHQRPQGAR